MQRQHNGQGAGQGVGQGVGESAREVSSAIADQASTAAEQVGRVVQQGVGRANAALSAVSERSGQAAHRTGEVLGNFRSAIETSARSQPTTTVALAAFAGFVLGSMWRMGGGNR